jgi:glycosyltransferase involved in cell wall biosynthesis
MSPSLALPRVLQRRSKPLRVLHLVTYPTIAPKDGGQIRVAAEVAVLREGGCDVFVLPIVGENWSRMELDDLAVVVSSSRIYQTGDPWPCHDVTLGRIASQDRHIQSEVQQRVDRVRPDVVVLDHPWLLPVFDSLKIRVPMIYSAHNVEWRLKEKNLEIIGEPSDVVEVWGAKVRALEEQALQTAALTVAVSDSDATWLNQFTKNPVPVAKNGTSRRLASPQRVVNWTRHFGDRNIGVFIASGHPPNAVGFWEMLGPSFGFLDPTQAVLSVGSVGAQIREHRDFLRHRSVNNARCLVSGFQPDRDVAAILEMSHAALLPITAGEGSNLKTAEALVSGRPIIATSRAFRGFEAFIGEQGVLIADTNSEFRAAVKEGLQGPRMLGAKREAADALLWSSALRPFADAVLEAGK